MFETLLLVSLSLATAAPPPQADPHPRRDAERAASRYEFLIRTLAPATRHTGRADTCDEVIGRFCFRFTDDIPRLPPPEHPDLTRARRNAIAAQRAWFEHEPGLPDAAAPLVRFLVEDDRAAEAVAVARSHARAADRDPASLLLLGLALHHSGAFSAAESVFDSARSALPERERARLDDVEMLLEPGERRAYARLSPEGREVYERRLWAFADPAMSDDGNERRAAHYARHAWTTILADAPRVTGRIAWGSDLEQILIRYGLPTSRERALRPIGRVGGAPFSMVETYDPHAVSFVPPALLTRGLPEAPVPGAEPELMRDSVRSSYAPVELHRMRGLRVQAARFPERRGSRLVVRGQQPPDTASPAIPERPRGLLVVLDTMGREVVRREAEARVRPDSVTELGAEVALPPGSYVYRLELADPATGLAGLTQYRLDIEARSPPGLSDLLVARGGGDSIPPSRAELAPLGDLVLPPGQRVLVWAEASALDRRNGEAHFAVEWWAEPVDERGVVGRAARWLGRRLGLVAPEEPIRVRWEGTTAEHPARLAFFLDLTGMEEGLYRLVLRLRDRVSGTEAVSRRLLRIDPSAAPLPSRTGH